MEGDPPRTPEAGDGIEDVVAGKQGAGYGAANLSHQFREDGLHQGQPLGRPGRCFLGLGHGLATVPLGKGELGMHLMHPGNPLWVVMQQAINLANLAQQVVGLLTQLATRRRLRKGAGLGVAGGLQGLAQRRWKHTAAPGAQPLTGQLITGARPHTRQTDGDINRHQPPIHKGRAVSLQAPGQILPIQAGAEPAAHHKPAATAAIHPKQPAAVVGCGPAQSWPASGSRATSKVVSSRLKAACRSSSEPLTLAIQRSQRS